MWVLHDCQLTWPAFDRNPVDQPGPLGGLVGGYRARSATLLLAALP